MSTIHLSYISLCPLHLTTPHYVHTTSSLHLLQPFTACYGISDTHSVQSSDSPTSTAPWFCDACKAGNHCLVRLLPTRSHTLINTHTHIYTHTHTHTPTHLHTCTHKHRHIHTHACSHTQKHKYICTYTMYLCVYI